MPRVQLPLHRPSASALELVHNNAAQISRSADGAGSTR